MRRTRSTPRGGSPCHPLSAPCLPRRDRGALRLSGFPLSGDQCRGTRLAGRPGKAAAGHGPVCAGSEPDVAAHSWRRRSHEARYGGSPDGHGFHPTYTGIENEATSSVGRISFSCGGRISSWPRRMRRDWSCGAKAAAPDGAGGDRTMTDHGNGADDAIADRCVISRSCCPRCSRISGRARPHHSRRHIRGRRL